MARTIGFAVKRSTGAQEPRLSRQGPAPVDREEVAKAAYELFERRGGTHGNDQQDWFEAERIVRQRHQGGGNGR